MNGKESGGGTEDTKMKNNWSFRQKLIIRDMVVVGVE